MRSCSKDRRRAAPASRLPPRRRLMRSRECLRLHPGLHVSCAVLCAVLLACEVCFGPGVRCTRMWLLGGVDSSQAWLLLVYACLQVRARAQLRSARGVASKSCEAGSGVVAICKRQALHVQSGSCQQAASAAVVAAAAAAAAATETAAQLAHSQQQQQQQQQPFDTDTEVSPHQ